MAGSSAGLSPKEHIEELRKTWFSIGGGINPLAPMLDKAVKYLSAELYTKDVHFLMELIQNAEDNEYLEGVAPSLEFVITSRDITGSGAPATLLMFNNEKGFSAKNIESICNVGNSTKTSNRKRGFIGEKGIGFKSVFLITAQPHIFSNGYQIRFNEKPCLHCKLGYIVPEWVEDSPSLSDIQQIYGWSSSLPTTILVLPLKPDKVKPVKQQLSSIQPEVLLFLSKIKRLSVREDNEDSSLNTVNAIAITKETNFLTRKNIDAESYTLHLLAEENGGTPANECSYYMWKQRFPVKPENQVERRMEVEEFVITLAFPHGERLHQGTSSPGVYAYLPTEMVTNFPFIIQADFLLASSRETILLDDRWNQGILSCVPSAFVNALVSLVKITEDAPASSMPRMFKFLPVNSSPYPKLNVVRETIKEKLAQENIIPIDSNIKQQFFYKPSEVGRILPRFRKILYKAQKQGVSLSNLSSHGWYVLSSSFDAPEHDPVLEFLGVRPVDNEWYAKCILSSNLVLGVSEDVYLELLLFMADYWSTNFSNTKMGSIPLMKYAGLDASVSLCSILESSRQNGGKTLCRSYHSQHVSWLVGWNAVFRCAANHFFLPKRTQEAIQSFQRQDTLVTWFRNVVKVEEFSVNDYANMLINNHLTGDRKLVIAYAHFLYHSFSKDFLSAREVSSLCQRMPVVDKYGNITTKSGVLVPANGSKWRELFASNPWRKEGYVELGEDYSLPAYYASQSTTGKQLMDFLKTHLGAADIPYISPPNAEIPTVYSPLSKENVFLLLDWIKFMRAGRINIPERFLTCIKQGSWLMSTLNGSRGYRPPSQSFCLDSNRGNSNWGNILQNGSVLVDIPLLDQAFYGYKIHDYREELKTIGVMFDYEEACEFIGKHLMSLASSSSLTRSQVISILNFIKFLRLSFLSPEKFVASVKYNKWLRTSQGDRSPVESVLYDQEWGIASQISDIPFIGRDQYGDGILHFKDELQLLGVVVGFSGNYQLVVNHLKHSSYLSSLTSEAFQLILECMRHHSSYSDELVKALQHVKCLKTDVGYRTPRDCYLSDPEWGCILQIFSGFPLVDSKFYPDSILSYKKELKRLGVKVEFEDAVKAFGQTFKQQASLSSITKEHVFSFLSCYRKLKGTSHKFPPDFKECIREVNWLRTRLVDYRSPRNCILFGPEWESISPITVLPFIDESDNWYGNGIRYYREELKSMGAITELKAGVELVAAGLCFPQDPSSILSANVLSLLQCVRILLEKKEYKFPPAFHKNLSRDWLKTHAGYRSSVKSCLFDSKWKYVKRTDGPFIDEEFYGSNIASYKQELNAIGVAVDPVKVCLLLGNHLNSLSDFAAIVRVYRFMGEHRWKPDPEGEDARKIWIPDGHASGKWVNPGDCVLHDKNGLFGSQLYVLDKYYEPDLLYFFTCAFDVKSNPSLDDYCTLWKVWERVGCQLSQAQCSAFWQCVLLHWSSQTQKTLAADLTKLPVVSSSGEIFLHDKHDVFIGDDLLLKDLFEEFSPRPVFIWYPQPSLPSLPRTKLLDIYRKLGVHGISESVKMQEKSLTGRTLEPKELNPKDVLFCKGLVRVVLGFLADPSLNMEAKKRHEAVQCLLNLTVLETADPITVDYSLLLSSGENVSVRASKMIRWHRESSAFFTQKLDRAGGRKNLMEYATYFAQAIAEGVLWETEDRVGELSELIKFAFLIDFDEEAVKYLMKSKNLQVFMEDEDFLSAAFPASG